jgi:hypothetical protein
MHAFLCLILLVGSLGTHWPLSPTPTVVHPFRLPSEAWGAGHRGVDLLGVAGQEVDAAAPGTVAFAGRIAGIGVVVVSHGTTRTTYQPVAPSVSLGQVVEAGAPLGQLELAGSHCLPRACLHWGLVGGRDYLDPLTLIDPATHVRLLPLDRSPSGAGRTARLATSIARLAGAALRGVSGVPTLLTLEDVPAGRHASAGPR